MQNSNSSGSGGESYNFNLIPTHYCTGMYCTICYPTFTWTFQQYHLTPHKCPICDGKTFVPVGFYPDADPEFTSKCRACTNGILWS